MMYTRFTVINSNKKPEEHPCYTQKKPPKSRSNLYTASYPEYLKLHTENPIVKADRERKENAETEYIFCNSESPSYAENESEKRGYPRFSAALAAVFTLMLGITFVYLSGVKAPSYINTAFMTSLSFLSEKYQEAFEYIEHYTENEVVSASDMHGTTQSGYNFISFSEENSEKDTETPQDDIFSGSFVAETALSESLKQNTQASGNINENAEQVSHQEDLILPENSGDAVIVSKNLSRGSDKVYAQNESGQSVEISALATSTYPIPAYDFKDDSPLVLIVHTHGTECYSDSTDNGETRSTDREKNVVRVGSELASLLNSYGIPTLHSKTMHDEYSYITSYKSSKDEVSNLLALYPSIKYVIDLHRDAIPNEGAYRVKPALKLGGEETAQVMLVMGTNKGGGNHPNYKENLTVAAHLQNNMNKLFPGLARPINVRDAIFNQNFSAGCMLLEVGSDANTLDEALSAVRLFARSFAQTVISGK